MDKTEEALADEFISALRVRIRDASDHGEIARVIDAVLQEVYLPAVKDVLRRYIAAEDNDNG